MSLGEASLRHDMRTKLRLALAAFAVTALVPSAASAAGGGGGDSTLTVLALLGLVAGAYLLARFVVGRLQRAFLVLTGVEFILLGALLGPAMPALLGPEVTIPALSDLSGLYPVVALAVGWVGLVRGMDLSAKRFREKAATTGALRVVVVQALFAGGLTTAAAYLVFTSGWLLPVEAVYPKQAWMASGVLGCAAAAGSMEPVALLERRYRLEGDVAERIRRMASMSDLLAILVFGLLFAIFHTTTEQALIELRATEWAVVSVFVGATLGVLFRPFLGDDDSENGRFLAMVGIIVFASGASYFLDLSPLLVNLCLGVVLVNFASAGAQIRDTLENTTRPLALVLLVFAGALVQPVDPASAVVVCLGYILLRVVSKAAGTALAGWRTPLRKDYFRGLLAHGEVSVAMAVSLRLVYEGPAVDLAYLAVLVSVIVNDLLAPRVLRGLLVDTGDLRGERKEQA